MSDEYLNESVTMLGEEQWLWLEVRVTVRVRVWYATARVGPRVTLTLTLVFEGWVSMRVYDIESVALG